MRRLIAPEITVRSKQGVFTVSTSDSGIGASLYRHGQYEYYSSLEAVRFLKAEGLLPHAGATMLDIGANIGIISIGLISSGEISKAIAIEPEPATLKLLQTNVEQNNLSDKVHIIACALGEKQQTLELEVSRNNKGDHRMVAGPRQVAAQPSRRVQEKVEVQVLPLDSLMQQSTVTAFLPQCPSLIWIDVQGFEGYVFRGATNLLKGGVPTVTEIWPEGIIYAGMSLIEFETILTSCFDVFYHKCDTGYEKRSISKISSLLQTLLDQKSFTNILLLNESGWMTRTPAIKAQLQ